MGVELGLGFDLLKRRWNILDFVGERMKERMGIVFINGVGQVFTNRVKETKVT